MSYQGSWYHFCRWMYARLTPRYKVEGMENFSTPSVLITRHLDGLGGTLMLVWFPVPFHLWALSKMVIYKECLKHHMEFFCPVRKGYGPIRTWLYSHIVSWPFSQLFRSMGAIPVYRGRREMIKTMNESVDTLIRGENILIIPDVDYTDMSAEASSMYAGFVYLARLYHQKCGKALSFYPAYPGRKHHVIKVGAPIVFDPSHPFHEEQERIVKLLRDELNLMATACGDMEVPHDQAPNPESGEVPAQ